jgi:exonuclease VII large subunit
MQQGNKSLINRVQSYREKLDTIRKGYGFKRPYDQIKQYQQQLDEMTRSQQKIFMHILMLHKVNIKKLEQRLTDLHPNSILKRGYCICKNLQNDRITTDANDLSPDDEIGIKFFQGGANASVQKILKSQKIERFLKDKNEESDF